MNHVADAVRRLERWAEDTCVVCPAQRLGLGEFDFDVVDRPSSSRYDPRIGHRVDTTGAPVCVHPYRVGLPPGAYASSGARPSRVGWGSAWLVVNVVHAGSLLATPGTWPVVGAGVSGSRSVMRPCAVRTSNAVSTHEPSHS